MKQALSVECFSSSENGLVSPHTTRSGTRLAKIIWQAWFLQVLQDQFSLQYWMFQAHMVWTGNHTPVSYSSPTKKICPAIVTAVQSCATASKSASLTNPVQLTQCKTWIPTHPLILLHDIEHGCFWGRQTSRSTQIEHLCLMFLLHFWNVISWPLSWYWFDETRPKRIFYRSWGSFSALVCYTCSSAQILVMVRFNSLFLQHHST